MIVSTNTNIRSFLDKSTDTTLMYLSNNIRMSKTRCKYANTIFIRIFRSSYILCGIYLTTKNVIDENVKNMVANRGRCSFFEVKTTDFISFSSTLQIREPYDDVNEHEFILLYNGEMYDNTASDTKTLCNKISKCIDRKYTCECHELTRLQMQNNELKLSHTNIDVDEHCFCMINSLIADISCEYEAAVVIVYKYNIYFFKDPLGRKSLTISVETENDREIITIASVGQKIELSPHFIYKYNYKKCYLSAATKNMSDSVEKSASMISYTINDYSDAFFVKLVHEKLVKSVQRRLDDSCIVVLFSGGIDSLLITILLHQYFEISKPIYLINTMFTHKKESHDRKICKIAYLELVENYPSRKFVLIENDVSFAMLNTHREHIKSLVYPKSTPMDFNIGACLWFSANAARKYGKIVYAGCGADELFCGYKSHKSVSQNIKTRIKDDIYNLWNRNLGRDDRVIADNDIEPRFPFLDLDLVKLILSLPEAVFLDSEKEQVGNKVILRQILRNLGFTRSALFAKKAMQFGSGIDKLVSK